jgi:hypothetical protein
LATALAVSRPVAMALEPAIRCGASGTSRQLEARRRVATHTIILVMLDMVVCDYDVMQFYLVADFTTEAT